MLINTVKDKKKFGTHKSDNLNVGDKNKLLTLLRRYKDVFYH